MSKDRARLVRYGGHRLDAWDKIKRKEQYRDFDYQTAPTLRATL